MPTLEKRSKHQQAKTCYHSEDTAELIESWRTEDTSSENEQGRSTAYTGKESQNKNSDGSP